MGDPANRALKGFLWRGGDTRMPESASRHVAKPASQQTVVEGRNAERALQELIPNVHEESRANPNGNCTEKERRVLTHDPAARRVATELPPWAVSTAQSMRRNCRPSDCTMTPRNE